VAVTGPELPATFAAAAASLAGIPRQMPVPDAPHTPSTDHTGVTPAPVVPIRHAPNIDPPLAQFGPASA
jgi:hypothetical protein